MIVFGTTGITSVHRRGSFHCPACGPGATYQEKGVRRFFTLFFIPLIPLDKVNQHILCDRCGGTFKPEVLDWNGVVPQSPVAGGPPPVPGMHHPPQMLHGSASTVSYQSNGVATASMILGILGLLTSFLLCPSVFFCVIGLVLGLIGLSRVKSGKGLVGGKSKAMTGVICSSLGLVAMVAMVFAFKDRPDTSGPQSPREKAATAISRHDAGPALGNSPKAVELAGAYAEMMTTLHETAFKSSKGKTKKARYVVHCELSEDSCAFLVSVPEYRKFTDDAEKSLEEIAWATARMVLKDEKSLDENADLCVGLKGVVMFGSVMTGSLADEAPTFNSKDASDLDAFFPSPETPAATGSDSK